jgi:hypothetical protein
MLPTALEQGVALKHCNACEYAMAEHCGVGLSQSLALDRARTRILERNPDSRSRCAATRNALRARGRRFRGCRRTDEAPRGLV